MKIKTISYLLILIVLASLSAQNDQPPSQNPPGGLKPEQVPMFVSFGFDDNSKTGYQPAGDASGGGIQWIVDFLSDKKNNSGTGNDKTYDGSPVRASFYLASCYVSGANTSDYAPKVKLTLHNAFLDGHEIGNHTETHNMAFQTAPHENISKSHWDTEITTCNSWLTKPKPDSTLPMDQPWGSGDPERGVGIPADSIFGFRAPFLKYNDKLFETLAENNILYDCSIEEGVQDNLTGDNFYWPYNLNSGSPAHSYLKENGSLNFSLSNHPKVWEMPAYQVIVPPDNECSKYDIDYSLRGKLAAEFKYFDEDNGKITGLDFNLFMQAYGGMGMNKAEVIATLKYTLDLRLKGNRAPLLFGCHPVEYMSIWNGSAETTARQRQEAIEEFIEYALTLPNVRVVPMIDVLRWCRNPAPLDPNAIINDKHLNSLPKINTISITTKGIITTPGFIAGTISIYNPAGKNIAQRDISNGRSIETVSLSRGMYIFQIKGDRFSGVQNVMIY